MRSSWWGKPIVFRGELTKYNGWDHFSLTHNDMIYGGHYMGCLGYANQLLDGRDVDGAALRNLFHDTAPIVTWGFYGEGTKLLAATMLALALKEKHDYWPRDAFKHSQRYLILKLHDKYAREVLAHLPPSNWTITGEEVKEWVKQQRKKHDKILREDNQKPVTV